jgi:hypothetical protein
MSGISKVQQAQRAALDRLQLLAGQSSIAWPCFVAVLSVPHTMGTHTLLHAVHAMQLRRSTAT